MLKFIEFFSCIGGHGSCCFFLSRASFCLIYAHADFYLILIEDADFRQFWGST